MNTIASVNETQDAAQRFIGLGLEILPVNAYQVPHHSDNGLWSAASDYPIARGMNLGVRGADGGRRALAVKVTCFDGINFQPLKEREAYCFLKSTADTLVFENEEMAAFIYSLNPSFIECSEHREGEASVYTGPLAGTRLITTTGVLAFGVTHSRFDGKTLRTGHSGTLRDVQDYPDFLQTLVQTGRIGTYNLMVSPKGIR